MMKQNLFIYFLIVILSISSWLGQSFQPITTTTTSLSRKRSCLVDVIVPHKHRPRRSYHTTITTKGIVSSSLSSKKTTYNNNNSSFNSLFRSSSSTIEKTKQQQQQQQWSNNIFLIKSKLSFHINKIIKNILYKIKQCQQVMKRRFLIVVIFFLVLFSPSFPTTTTSSNNSAWAAAAGPAGVTRSRSTGGRVSGSFGRSSTSSPSAPKSRPSYSPSPPSSTTRSYSNYRPRPTYYYKPRRPRIIVPPPTRHIHVYNNPPHPTTSTTTTTIIRHQQRGPTVGDLMLVTGTGLLITYGIMKHYDNQDRDGQGGGDAASRSALGYGVSVVSLTVALIVPDRFDEDSILTRIKNLASNTQSNSRRSVQKLVSSATLELLRQDKAIVSVGTEYKHFQKLQDAERQFNIMSLEKRSKFDKETFNNADGTIETTNTSSSINNKSSSSATTAVIDISLCIEGDTTKFSTIKNRSQLRDALYRISADAQVEECLLAAEVLWTPDDDGDNMSESDVFADYPTLVPLFD